MQVLHSIWDTEIFHIWSESSALPLEITAQNKRHGKPLLHLFALTGTELKRHLFGSFMLDGSDIDTLTLQLPCGKGGLGPIPSPWLLREDYLPKKAVGLVDCTITTLALKPDLALDLLLGVPLQLKDGFILADSMLFWSKLALFSIELVAREQFIPAILEGKPLWKPVLDYADQDRLNIFFSSIPPSCLASRSLQGCQSLPQPPGQQLP